MTSEERIKELECALSKFSNFGHFIKAAAEYTEQADELKSTTCITSVMAGGGSDYLWWSDFELAMKVMERKNA